MSKSTKTVALWVLLILMFWAIYQIVGKEDDRWSSIGFGEAIGFIDSGIVQGLRIEVESSGVAELKLTTSDGLHHRTRGLVDRAFLEKLDSQRVPYGLSSKPESFWSSILVSWLPML